MPIADGPDQPAAIHGRNLWFLSQELADLKDHGLVTSAMAGSCKLNVMLARQMVQIKSLETSGRQLRSSNIRNPSRHPSAGNGYGLRGHPALALKSSGLLINIAIKASAGPRLEPLYILSPTVSPRNFLRQPYVPSGRGIRLGIQSSTLRIFCSSAKRSNPRRQSITAIATILLTQWTKYGSAKRRIATRRLRRLRADSCDKHSRRFQCTSRITMLAPE